jgi:hypothetical protein
MADATTSGEGYLSREEAGAFLQTHFRAGTPQLLAKLAVTGGGPRFYKFCRRALYTREDLEEWARKKMGEARTSTSDHAQQETRPSKVSTSNSDRPQGNRNPRPNGRVKARRPRAVV